MGMTVAVRETKLDSYHNLLDAIAQKQARVAVVGLGYVGLPLALTFAERGFRVVGLDIDSAKVEKLNRGESYIRHVDPSRIVQLREVRRFSSTSEFRCLRSMDVILVCVPTPLGEHNEPDLSFVTSTSQDLCASLRPGQLIVLESTTYPGTTEEVVLPILEESGLRCYPGEKAAEESDFYLAYSPEREDPGNAKIDSRKIPKVVAGVNAASLELASRFYAQAFATIAPISSTRAAEMTKLLENIYRAVNIAMINELKMLCLRMGIDIWEVIEAASTKPFGFSAFYPGPGLGGHCIPIDPFYLTWKAKEYDFPTRFIELAGQINAAMPQHVVDAVEEALGQRGKTLNGARLLVLGVAYKRDVDDTRESPALKIMRLLQSRGATVAYHDPYVPRLNRMRKYDFGLHSLPLTSETLRAHDCTLIVTDHSALDYDRVVNESLLVVDTRHATARVKGDHKKIVYC